MSELCWSKVRGQGRKHYLVWFHNFYKVEKYKALFINIGLSYCVWVNYFYFIFVCITASLSELRSRFTDLEEQLRVKAETLKSIQNEVAQNKKDLAAKELNLQKLQDELSLAHTRMAQESERVSTLQLYYS